MAKGESNVAKDLERLSRRIQELKMRLRESGTRTKHWETSLHLARKATDNIKERPKFHN